MIKDTVKELLENNPHLRDDTVALVQTVWTKEIEELGYPMLLLLHEVTNYETIARWSRKLQRENPRLRGEGWNRRQHVLEPKARKEFKQEPYRTKNDQLFLPI